MGLDTNILIDAMLKNISNPSEQQKAEIGAFADAVKQFVQSADIIYQPNLTSATGGAVSAVVSTDTIAKLQ